jgi:hypothetical protein
VKTICAWCQKTIQVRCEHCNGVLIEARAIGGTFGFYGEAMICLNGETPIVYTDTAVRAMQTTHEICQDCAELPAEIRDGIIAARRAEKAKLPSAADLDKIIEERRIKEATEKRGPTEVPRSATIRAEDRPDKSHAPGRHK